MRSPPVLRGRSPRSPRPRRPSRRPSRRPGRRSEIASALRAGCGGACLLSRAVRLFRLAGLGLIELCVGGVAAAGRLLVELVRLLCAVAVALLLAFLVVFLFLVFFVEVLLVEVVFLKVFVVFQVVLVFHLGRGAGDLVDGHLAQHGAEIGRALHRLFFVQVFDLLDGTGVDARARGILRIKELLGQQTGTRREAGGGSA